MLKFAASSRSIHAVVDAARTRKLKFIASHRMRVVCDCICVSLLRLFSPSAAVSVSQANTKMTTTTTTKARRALQLKVFDLLAVFWLAEMISAFPPIIVLQPPPFKPNSTQINQANEGDVNSFSIGKNWVTFQDAA